MLRQGSSARLLPALAMLAACGGEGAGGTKAPNTPVAGPGIGIAPAPSSPEQPVFSYRSPNDFTAGYSLKSTLGYSVQMFLPDRGANYVVSSVRFLPEDQPARLDYVAWADTFEYTPGPVMTRWTPAERDPNDGFFLRSYSRPSGNLWVGFERQRLTYATRIGLREYAGPAIVNGEAGRMARITLAVFGAETMPNDIPSGVAYYNGDTIFSGGSSANSITNQVDPQAVFAIGFSGNSVEGGISFLDHASRPSSMQLFARGQIDRATGTLSGTLFNTERNFTGTFKGRLFGPQGREMVVVFNAVRASDGLEIGGDFIGVR